MKTETPKERLSRLHAKAARLAGFQTQIERCIFVNNQAIIQTQSQIQTEERRSISAQEFGHLRRIINESPLAYEELCGDKPGEWAEKIRKEVIDQYRAEGGVLTNLSLKVFFKYDNV